VEEAKGALLVVEVLGSKALESEELATMRVGAKEEQKA
jgi:hypothetical protein